MYSVIVSVSKKECYLGNGSVRVFGVCKVGALSYFIIL